MEFMLEEQRRYHEERERLVDAITKEILRRKTSNREQINSDHLVKSFLDRYVDTSKNLMKIVIDQDGSKKREIQALGGPHEFSEFYTRLKALNQFHKRNLTSGADTVVTPLAVELENLASSIRENEEEEPITLVNFTDEEGYGKFLDLNECYHKYINLKGIEKIDYLKYLSQYDHLFAIPKDKKNIEYKRYLSALNEYLYDYISRVKPLLDLEGELEKAEQDFENKWSEGSFPGWQKETSGALAKSGAYLDLTPYSSAQELASLGLDRLKSALMALGLKCGGTLEERATRLFTTKTKRLQDLDSSLFAKSQDTKKGVKESNEKQKEIGLYEARLYKLSEILSEHRQDTIENVQRKQARTGDEREEDEDDANNEEYESDHEYDDGAIYNPKNLPLGWDGKPIPYWLYKLHGLNLYYKCEICGNQKYRGPKAFHRHFTEWRHAHGMRCLGIPNTPHFHNITKIEDAVMLWEKLKVTREQERWKPENEEEYEDANGNVFNKKTHEDLKRQGLL